MCINFNIALYHESRNEIGESHKIYKKILEYNPFFIEAEIKLGEHAKLRGNKDKAIEYMKSAIDKHFYKPKEQNLNILNINNIEQNNLNTLKNNISNNNNINKLFPFMTKPINPLLLKAQIQFERGYEDDTKNILLEIEKMSEGKDPYTQIFIGNTYYDSAIQNRNKEDDFKKYMKEALSFYVSALEVDKYNAYAAIGIANIFSEYSMTNYSLDVYKNVIEKLPNNINSYANEALIYMSDKKFEKAGILINKLLKKFYNGKNPRFENILAKIYMEMKDYEKAFNILKSLMLRQPDDLFYKYNYAFCLWAKSENIISKKERRVFETQEAIRNLEKAHSIFESLYRIKRERGTYFKNENDEKLLLSSDFYYKCKLMLDCVKTNYEACKNLLDFDYKKENETKIKIEENRQTYLKMLVCLFFI